MTTPETQGPTVTQADRELAADILELQERHELADLVRAGDRDSSNTVQTVTRHREAAEAASRAEVERLQEALDAAADRIERAAYIMSDERLTTLSELFFGYADQARAALAHRSQSEKGGG